MTDAIESPMVYRTAPVSMTLNDPKPKFQRYTIIAEYPRNGSRYRHTYSYNEILTGTSFSTVSLRMILSDLISEIVNDAKHRAVSLRQLSFLSVYIFIFIVNLMLLMAVAQYDHGRNSEVIVDCRSQLFF